MTCLTLWMPTSGGAPPLPAADPAPLPEQARITHVATPASGAREYRTRDPAHNTLIPELLWGSIRCEGELQVCPSPVRAPTSIVLDRHGALPAACASAP